MPALSPTGYKLSEYGLFKVGTDGTQAERPEVQRRQRVGKFAGSVSGHGPCLPPAGARGTREGGRACPLGAGRGMFRWVRTIRVLTEPVTSFIQDLLHVQDR